MQIISHKAKAKIKRSLLSRFTKSDDGATAVEFGLVAAPFFALIAAILESSILFFNSQYVETAISDVTRKIRTGVLNDVSTEADFKQAICDEIVIFIDCNDIATNVQVAATFDELGNVPPDDEGNIQEEFQNFAPLQIIKVTATYKFPVFTLYTTPFAYKDTGFALIHATAVTRTEPYTPSGT